MAPWRLHEPMRGAIGRSTPPHERQAHPVSVRAQTGAAALRRSLAARP